MRRFGPALLRLAGVVATAAVIVFVTALIVVRTGATYDPGIRYDGPGDRDRHFAALPGESVKIRKAGSSDAERAGQ